MNRHSFLWKRQHVKLSYTCTVTYIQKPYEIEEICQYIYYQKLSRQSIQRKNTLKLNKKLKKIIYIIENVKFRNFFPVGNEIVKCFNGPSITQRDERFARNHIKIGWKIKNNYLITQCSLRNKAVVRSPWRVKLYTGV
jgi:hypothetical protein